MHTLNYGFWGNCMFKLEAANATDGMKIGFNDRIMGEMPQYMSVHSLEYKTLFSTTYCKYHR